MSSDQTPVQFSIFLKSSIVKDRKFRYSRAQRDNICLYRQSRCCILSWREV